MYARKFKCFFLFLVIIVAVISVLIFEIYHLSSSDWESEAPLYNPLELIGRKLVRWGNTIPGVRLMYGGENGFPLKDLTIWDTLFGCLIYGLAFLFLLWLTTPLPDLYIHHFVMINFQSREHGLDDEDFPDLIDVPIRHPAGGEGPLFQPQPRV